MKNTVINMNIHKLFNVTSTSIFWPKIKIEITTPCTDTYAMKRVLINEKKREGKPRAAFLGIYYIV